MFDCPLVSTASLASMFAQHGHIDASRQYGYGWFLTPRFQMHGGGTPGFISRIRQYPEQKVSIVMLLNANHLDPDRILEQVESLVA